MKIAIVGKGGSGKTTTSGLLSVFFAQNYRTLSIDADINIHFPKLVLDKYFDEKRYLSESQNTKDIKTFLKGNNKTISDLVTFRKTTPPGNGSNIINFESKILDNYTYKIGNLKIGAVGSYQKEEIGASCYHNNLAILENILSHYDDRDSIFLVDMVAGVDAFASSLHAQFDMVLLVIEPTQKGVDVFEQYIQLAKEAGVDERVFCIGNKVFDEDDEKFLVSKIGKEKIIGYIGQLNFIKKLDRDGGVLSYDMIDENTKQTLQKIFSKLKSLEQNPDDRLEILYALHKKYVAQGFIKDRFGDLTNQIDTNFSFN